MTAPTNKDSNELRQILRQLVINCDEDPMFMSDENYFIQAEQAIAAHYARQEAEILM